MIHPLLPLALLRQKHPLAVARVTEAVREEYLKGKCRDCRCGHRVFYPDYAAFEDYRSCKESHWPWWCRATAE